jgi:hypothetical protein
MKLFKTLRHVNFNRIIKNVKKRQEEKKVNYIFSIQYTLEDAVKKITQKNSKK